LAFDRARDAHLEDLALQRALAARQGLRPDIARKLHADRAETLHECTCACVRDEGAGDTLQVHAAVLVEPFVLDREKRIGHVVRQVGERYDVVLDRREVGKLITIAIDQYGRAARLVAGESLHPGTAADTAAIPEYRDDRPDDGVGNEQVARPDGAHAGGHASPHALQPRAQSRAR